MPSAKPIHLALLDLPDEPIARIFSHLHAQPVLTCISFRHISSSLALALSNTRLLSIFRSIVHTIDTAFPLTSDHPPVVRSAQLSCRSLAQVASVLGPSLRAFRLPRLAKPEMQRLTPLLATLATCCPSLETLMFSDAGFLGLSLAQLSQLFKSVKHIEIVAPVEPTVHALRKSAVVLTHLALLDVRPSSVKELERLVRKRGSQLDSLQLSFDIMAEQGCNMLFGAPPGWPVPRFASFIANNSSLFSKLCDLDVCTSPSPVVDLSFFPTQEDQLNIILGQVKYTIVKARLKSEREGTKGRGLKHLRVRALEHSVEDCVSAAEKLIGMETDVEIGLPGLSLVFHGSDILKESKTSFGVLGLGTFLTQDKERWSRMMDGIKVLQIGDRKGFKKCTRAGDVNKAVTDVVGHGREEVKTIRSDMAIITTADMRGLCVYLGDLFDRAPNAERLEISEEIVDLSQGMEGELMELANRMSNVKVIHMRNALATHFSRIGGESTRAGEGMTRLKNKMGFLRRVGTVLDIFAERCKRLECIIIDGSESDGIGETAEGEQLIKIALEGVDKFEDQYKNVDVGSVRSLVEHWGGLTV